MSEFESLPPVDTSESFFTQILNPGSSLHPTFLLALDLAFVFLLLVLVGLLFITGGNLHFVGLICVELALWGSIKWFVNELHQIPAPQPQAEESKKEQ
ncbi:hypothetical protein CYLTODRAFT_418555 [Cylindrobasidium torrendii FP15055 ss-10]|uniref:Pkr1-domain-containing protein n=1 Tax=Cylindrobasidium torrendii FP15055 ss-10 TaxID=1314674 RepID=A0A0D7BMQ6_9AGAR|nr:hypothetical protein CYLTODRAFT_418555 [Cylindrobasidium torrendii FP15055 ss-10]